MKRGSVLAVSIVAVLIVAGIATALVLTNENKASTNQGNNNQTVVDGRAASFQITSFSINKHDVMVNETAKVSVVVENNGTKDGNYTANLTLDGNQYQQQTVHLDVNGTTTLIFEVASSVGDNHTVAIGGNSTYLHCYQSGIIGSYAKFQITGVSYGISVNGNWTETLISKDKTTYTVKEVYQGVNIPTTTHTFVQTASWTEGLQNLTFMGNESVSTHYGIMGLSHYRTYDGTFTTELYTCIISNTSFPFKMVVQDGTTALTFELVDTNEAWLPYVAVQ